MLFQNRDHLRQSTPLQQQALETARMNFLDSNPYLPMDSIGMYKVATCRIHLCNDDPYKELLHNVDEVETLLQDTVVLAAIHRLLDPDADLNELRVSALQSKAISPEERALTSLRVFSGRTVETRRASTS